MEVMAGAAPAVEAATRPFLDGFEIIALDDRFAERAVALRQAHKVKLPDAIIWAPAQAGATLLATRNTKDFPAGDPGVRMPYVSDCVEPDINRQIGYDVSD
jgi:predicted nucleic acid-binding protein